MAWISGRNMWSGDCPRCGKGSYFAPAYQGRFSDSTLIDVVDCPGGHPFVICSGTNPDRIQIVFVLPISGESSIPIWLPDEYRDAYSEMCFDYNSGKYRSAVALAGIILDSHVNSLLKSKLDKRKPLGKRLEILIEAKYIDQDQFSDGTVARLSRNDVIHPDTIAALISQEDALDTMDAVSGCLERFYKWRRAKALPAPKEQVGDDSADSAIATETSSPDPLTVGGEK